MKIKIKHMKNTIKQALSPLTMALVFCVLVILWSLYPIAAKVAVTSVPPLLFTSIRLGLAAMIMAVVSGLTRRTSIKLTRREHWWLLLVSIGASAFPSAAFAFAALYVPAGTCAVLWAFCPVIMALVSLQDRDEVRGGLSLLVALLMGGLGVLIGTGLTFASTLPAVIAGIVVLIAAACSAFTLRIIKHQLPGIPIAQLAYWQIVEAAILCGIASFCVERQQIFALCPQNLTLMWAIGGLLYPAICTCGCNALTYLLVRRIGAVRTAYSDFLVPVATLILAHFLLSEPITWTQIMGLTFTICGVLILVRKAPNIQRTQNISSVHQPTWRVPDRSLPGGEKLDEVSLL